MVVLLDLDALPGDAAAAEDAVAVEADDAGAADGAEDRVCAVDELGQRVRGRGRGLGHQRVTGGRSPRASWGRRVL